MLIRSIIIAVLLAPLAIAQLPGDFNCSGTVNGVDYVYLFTMYRYGLVDSGNCTWYNGDLNGDSLFHTVADLRQFIRMMHGDTSGLNPPMPFDLDTISVGNATPIPGEMVSLPLNITIPERIFDFMIHLRFETTWVDSWRMIKSDSSPVGYFYEGDYYWWNTYEPDNLEPGSYSVGNLILTISPDCPAGTEIPIMLVAGEYYPSGFSNDSYPTYFISPILIDGLVQVNPSGIDGDKDLQLPDDFLTAYPNPFNSSVKIKWLVSSLHGDESVKIYDISGRLVQTLTIPVRAGEVIWDGKDYDGHSVTSGVYFARLTGRDMNQSVKLTLLK